VCAGCLAETMHQRQIVSLLRIDRDNDMKTKRLLGNGG